MLKQKLAARRLTCVTLMFACLVAPAFSAQPACAQAGFFPCLGDSLGACWPFFSEPMSQLA